MVIPAAMNIESALESIGTIKHFWREDQQKELTSAIGATTAIQIGVAFPLSDEFRRGYELGLQTARNIVAGSAELLTKGADPANVL